MSQVTFKTEQAEIVAGWDRPLRGFFLSVFNPDGDEDHGSFYESLGDHQTHGGFLPTVDYFKAVLTRLGIQAPEGFWGRVELRESNVTHTLTAKGWETW